MLLIALGLSGLVAFEMRHDIVTARELIPTPIEQSPSKSGLQSNSGIAPESQTPATSPTQQPSQPSQLLGADMQQAAVAIDSQPKRDGMEPKVSQADSAELATAVWTGASFPVENFQAYTSPFGYRQAPDGSYRQEFHYGLDMAAPNGSYIRNWWSGKVVEVSDNSNCGTSVVVESGDWLHIYCHMRGHVETQGGNRYIIDRDAGIQIWEGQQIVAGARIGRVGMTGRTTGPHLHWGLKYQDNWVDPALVLRAMYAGQRSASRQQN
jgi:murein DD-endopeptidase MepM/ murein hydrolase activator NlpD